MQCQAIAESTGKQCRRTGAGGLCAIHSKQVASGKTVRRVTAQPVVQPIRTTTLTDLPADVIRYMSNDLPAMDILELCRVTRQLYGNLCEDIVFWRRRADTLGVKYDERTNLNALIKAIIMKETEVIRRRINVYDLIEGEGDEYPTDLPVFDIFDDVFHGHLDIAVPALDVFTYLQQQYADYLEIHSDPDPPSGLVSLDEFNKRINDLDIQEGDIIEHEIPGSDYEVYTDYYVYEDNGELMMVPFQITETIHALPKEAHQLLADIYALKRRPIALEDLRDVYSIAGGDFDYTDSQGHQHMLGTRLYPEDSDVKVIDGIPMLILKVRY